MAMRNVTIASDDTSLYVPKQTERRLVVTYWMVAEPVPTYVSAVQSLTSSWSLVENPP